MVGLIYRVSEGPTPGRLLFAPETRRPGKKWWQRCIPPGENPPGSILPGNSQSGKSLPVIWKGGILPAKYRQIKITFKDITWIEGVKDYIKINLRPPAKPLLVRMSMKGVEEELPSAQFIRIHKSYIVSIDSITSVRKSSVFIDQLELPVGETYQSVIEQLTKRKGQG